jgi:cysteinyl-tRNA synthetase
LTQRAGKDVVSGDVAHPVLARFAEALADDLNVSGALGEMFAWLGEGHDEPAVALAVLRKIDEVLGVLTPAAAAVDPGAGPDPDKLAKALDEARAAKDFTSADRIRKELQDAGYEVMTTKAGTTARKKLA